MIQNNRVLKALLWLLAAALVIGGIVLDHRHGKSRMPSGLQSSTIVTPKASSPT